MTLLTFRHYYGIFLKRVTTQADRLKTVRKSGNTAHFEAMFDAKICSRRPHLSSRPACHARHERAGGGQVFLRQSTAIVFFGYIQPKQLQTDYVSGHKKEYKK